MVHYYFSIYNTHIIYIIHGSHSIDWYHIIFRDKHQIYM